MSPIELKDRELIENACSIIAKRFKEDYHHIGAALRTKSGKVFSSVHLEAYVGRVALKQLRSEWQRQQEIRNLRQ